MAVLLPEQARPTPLGWEEDLRRSAGELLRVLPAIAAAGVGSLYFVGAVTKMAQLGNAGVSLGDAMPLIPLPQLLALSLPTVGTAGILLLAFVVVHPLLPRATDRAARTLAQRLPRRPALVLAAVIGAVVIWQLLLAPPLLLVGVFGALLVGGRLRHRPVVAGAAVAGVVVLVSVVAACLNPAPLPSVAVRTIDGRLVRGRLIAITDSSWFVTAGPRRISSVPAGRIARTAVTSSSAPRPESTLDGLRDLAP